MGRAVTSPILRLIRQVVEDPQVRNASDYDLLQRFSGQRDEAAFRLAGKRLFTDYRQFCRFRRGPAF
jgi:hypothetical protein